MLTILNNPVFAFQWCQEQRRLQRTIGFVPTMGALHQGHLSLLELANKENDVSCASIFVNPLQFNEPDDYVSYPCDRERDHRLLEKVGCNMVFSGTHRDMFPEAVAIEDVELLDAGRYAQGLEGTFRPGHLEGVCTVVDRLFRFVGDCRAYFGLKDYQQTLVVQDLAKRLGFPQIRTGQTVRDENGLALSSRNTLLSAREIELAGHIYQALLAAKNAWNSDCRDCDQLRTTMAGHLLPPIKIEYADVRDPYDWQAASPVGIINHAIALIAVKIGNVRLIDNLRLG